MLKRSLLGFVAFSVVGIVILLVMFFSWRSDIVDAREADKDRHIVSTALGSIEYASVGRGFPALLALHGTPGGYDQVLASRRALPLREFSYRTISVSRPGYRGTPLASNSSFAQQADLFAALLDELDLQRVVVFAASGGGYAGIQFAIRHPKRTAGLILSSPSLYSEPLSEGEEASIKFKPPGAAFALLLEISMWLFNEIIAGAIMSNYDPTDAVQVAMWDSLSRASIPLGANDPGRLNDLTQRLDPAIDAWPLEEIQVPTLILHGTADENSSYDISQDAARRIPNARLITFAGGDHFIPITDHEKYAGHVRDFVNSLRSSD